MLPVDAIVHSNTSAARRVATILVVDDHDILRRSLRDFIVSLQPSAVIHERRDVPGTLDVCLDCMPDLVLMDVELPSGSGIDLTRSIKARHPQMRIAIVTSHHANLIRELAMQAGADHFIDKARVFTELPPLLAAFTSPGLHPGEQRTTPCQPR